MKNTNKSAFTIVETLVTLLAITIMITAPLTFMYRSYSYSQLIRARIVATGLSQEGLELSTSLRNADVEAFKAEVNLTCADGCSIDWDGFSPLPRVAACTSQISSLSDDSCRLGRDDDTLFKVGGEPTDFFRKIKFTENPDRTGFIVESLVWSDVNGVKVQVNLKKLLFNINIK